ncbi:hypothetical protein [Tenacibaculum maritimum]|nr:hypothetical protein [Tenacibaculum maritimum]MCD9620442.1 hypothetical protein [Tenacibaculum maritimum]MCD9626635.1 hypothetical protein [Tenacibaculum maritimum]MCD9634193.1 hypothetical protein [Tenacibaculum maritimum]
MQKIKVFLGIFLIYGVLAFYYPPSFLVSMPLGVYIIVKGLSENRN